MIREMKKGDEGKVRAPIAKLAYEDQIFWRTHTKSLKECWAESRGLPVSGEIRGKNVIFVAEENGIVAGVCWCTIVDRGTDKQGEIAEIYVEKKFRGKGLGKELMEAAKQLFLKESVAVAFAWTHRGNEAAVKFYRDAGFKKVNQIVLAFEPSTVANGMHNNGSAGS